MVFWKTIRDESGKALACTLILLAAIVAAILYYPEFKEKYRLWIQVVPKFGVPIIGDVLQLGYGGYIGFQQYMKGVNAAGAIFAVLLGAGSVAREVETGTIQFLLAQPVSRTSVMVQKFAALVILIAAPIFLSSLAIVPLSRAIGETIDLRPLVLCSAYLSLELCVILSYAMLFSVLFDEQIREGGAAGGVTAVMAILLMIEKTNSLSLFSHSSLGHLKVILSGQGFPWVDAAWFATISLALVALSTLVFRRKDL